MEVLGVWEATRGGIRRVLHEEWAFDDESKAYLFRDIPAENTFTSSATESKAPTLQTLVPF